MSGPKNARPQAGGGRKYVWGNPTETFDSVTTILGRVLAKPAIAPWAARTCGEFVRDNFGTLSAVMRSDPEAVVTMVKQSPWKKRDDAADRGTLVHALAEAIALGQTPTVPDELKGYVAGWSAWVHDFKVKFEAAEMTVYSRQHGYAGTLDAIVETPSLGRILCDWKTGKDVYPEASLQLTAYRYADFAGMPDGTEAEVPEVEGTYVVHLMDGDYDMVPVRSDRYSYESWLAVLDLFAWTNRHDLIGASMGSGARLL